ncbi:hypothetical protein BvCmsNSNP030_3371 [Escherichia coli]|nr:hypothetical protein BvCmsNSNP030_3371 [Escherichia coli]
MLNYSQLRERSVVLLVGNLLKESSMVNPPVRRGDWWAVSSLILVNENDADSVTPG